MKNKLINQREININIKYNSKRLIYQFNFYPLKNHFDLNSDEKIKQYNLLVKNIARSFSEENSVLFRMSFKDAFKMMDKRIEKIFKKFEKQIN